MHKIVSYIIYIFILFLGKSMHGQNETLLYVANGTTFSITNDVSIHVKNGIVQGGDAVAYSLDEVSGTIEVKAKTSSVTQASKVKAIIDIAIASRTSNSQKKLVATTITSKFPFQKFPYDSHFKVANTALVCTHSTVYFKFVKAKKLLNFGDLRRDYYQDFILQIKLQNEVTSTIQLSSLDLNEIVFLHLSRPPPSIIV